MAVRIIRRGVIPFVLHKGVFEGCSCGFMLVHEPFGICVAHSYIVHSDAAVFGVVFDNHIFLPFFGYYRSNKSRFTILAEEFNKIFPILPFSLVQTVGFLVSECLSLRGWGILLAVIKRSRLKSRWPLELTAEDTASCGEHFSLAEMPSNRSFPASVRSSILISMVDGFIVSCG
nr:MAG TPA: hypothetical protein [Caudoviricetes sp.]